MVIVLDGRGRGSRFSKSASALYAVKFVRAGLKEEGRTGYPFR